MDVPNQLQEPNSLALDSEHVADDSVLRNFDPIAKESPGISNGSEKSERTTTYDSPSNSICLEMLPVACADVSMSTASLVSSAAGSPIPALISNSVIQSPAPYRLSIRGLSEIVSNVAHSIFDRFENVSRLSGTFLKSSHNVSLKDDRSVQVSKTRASFESQFDYLPSTFSQDTASHARHSVDEDLWQSVHSLSDSTFADVASPSGLHFPDPLTSEDKENIPITEFDSESLCMISHSVAREKQDVVNRDGPGLLTEDVHENGPGCPMVQFHHDSWNTDLAQEWSSLHEEVYALKSVVNILSQTLSNYERLFLESESFELDWKRLRASEIFRIAREKNEALNQAATMHRACEDMMRRLLRAKEIIELKKKKQKVSMNVLDSCAQKYRTMTEKSNDKFKQLLSCLENALAQQDQTQEANHRQLDKLRLDIRQYELRNSALSGQLKQLQRDSEELTKISQQFFE